MYRQTKEITSSPLAIQQYLKTLFPKKGGKGKGLPTLILKKENVSIDKAKAKQYAQVCGFKSNNDFVPSIYPHIIAFSLHMELLLDKNFPFQIVGMVHINNTITQYKPIPYDANLTLEVYFDEMKEHAKGKIIPIITKFYHYGELVWESRSENLKITKKSDSKGKKSSEAALEGEQEKWSLDTYAGLRYAKVAGDINPIHLFPITAKAFGFKRHIIHGMWTKARAVAALQEQIGNKAFKVHVDFKLPIFLPAKITFTHKTSKQGIDFEVRDNKNEKPHVKGEVTFL
ncbi:MAG: MaoC/PaaZ C-terminal domain-containing protein [Chitinophagales bacterium]